MSVLRDEIAKQRARGALAEHMITRHGLPSHVLPNTLEQLERYHELRHGGSRVDHDVEDV